MFCFTLIVSKTIACIYQTHRNVLSGNKYPGPSQAVKGLMLIFRKCFEFPPNVFQAMKLIFSFSDCSFTVGTDLAVH